jgi:steroid delta-isomerase-like uncharacterized protein
VVEQHVRLENAHDLEGVLRTFGDAAKYDDEAWGEHHEGRDGVRVFYEQLMKALPDLEIDVQRRHITEDAIVLEVVIRLSCRQSQAKTVAPWILFTLML